MSDREKYFKELEDGGWVLHGEDLIYREYKKDGFFSRVCKPHMCIIHPGDTSCIYCAGQPEDDIHISLILEDKK